MMVLRTLIVGQTPDPVIWRLFWTCPGARRRASVPERVPSVISDFGPEARLNFARLWSSTRCDDGVARLDRRADP